MNKKVALGILSILSMFVLVGCNNNAINNGKNKENNVLISGESSGNNIESNVYENK